MSANERSDGSDESDHLISGSSSKALLSAIALNDFIFVMQGSKRFGADRVHAVISMGIYGARDGALDGHGRLEEFPTLLVGRSTMGAASHMTWRKRECRTVWR